MGHLNVTDDLVRDIAYAARVMRKAPTFAVTAVLSIALGIGASLFGVVPIVAPRGLIDYPARYGTGFGCEVEVRLRSTFGLQWTTRQKDFSTSRVIVL